VTVALSTSGVNLDQDGYVVLVDPSLTGVVGPSGSIRLEGVPAGQRGVRLSGLAANCSVQGPNPLTVEVLPAGETTAGFDVRCWPPVVGKIAFTRAFRDDDTSSLRIINPEGGFIGNVRIDGFAVRPSWSPDGSSLAFTGGADDEFEHLVFVRPQDASVSIQLPGCHSTAFSPRWSPDGRRLLCLSEDGLVGGTLFSIGSDGNDPRSLTPDRFQISTASYLDDGSIVFLDEDFEQGGVFRMATETSPPVRLFGLPPDLSQPDENVVPSPDGSWVAFARSRVGVELFVMDTETGTSLNVAPGIGLESPPSWSPEGQRLAFIGARHDSGIKGLWLVDPDGTDLVELPVPGPLDFPASADWSPDGTRLVVAAVTGTFVGEVLSDLYTIRADGSDLQRLTASSEYRVDPDWGP
jgi:Tol biopolymer transport system component